MNYAALIALLAALAFTLPFLARLAENAGIPRGFSMMTTLAAGVFALVWVIARGRIQRRLAVEERIVMINRQRAEAPHSPEAFSLHGDQLGDLLLTLGRQREALAAFEAYEAIAKSAGEDVTAVQQVARKLRLELGEERL